MNALHDWLIAQRLKTADGSGLARAIDYSLKRWPALARYVESGILPIDNNMVENAIRPITLGRRNWLLTGPERAGCRAAAIQSLLATAKLNGWSLMLDSRTPWKNSPPGSIAGLMSCCRSELFPPNNRIWQGGTVDRLQFTSHEFTKLLKDNEIQISMDGKGCWRDNVFVERLWKSVKYEEVYLKAYDSVSDAKVHLGAYLNFFNTRRRKPVA